MTTPILIIYITGAFVAGLITTVVYVQDEVKNNKEIAVAPAVILVMAATWPVAMVLGLWFLLAKLIVRVINAR